MFHDQKSLMNRLVLVMVGITMCLSSITYVPSACKGYKKHENLMIAAAGDALWENKAACGRSYLVRYIGGRNKAAEPCILSEIVDRCEHCHATINLSQEAFTRIANLDAGAIQIEYELFM